MQEALVLKRMSEAAYMHDMSTVGIHGGTYWHTDMQTGWMLTKASACHACNLPLHITAQSCSEKLQALT